MRYLIIPLLCTLALAACDRAAPTDSAAPAATSIAPVPAAPPPPPSANTIASRPPLHREFKDFVVGCDNTGGCTAVGVQRETETGMYLVLARGAGPGGALSLQVASTGNEAFKAADLTVDAKPSPVSGLAGRTMARER